MAQPQWTFCLDEMQTVVIAFVLVIVVSEQRDAATVRDRFQRSATSRRRCRCRMNALVA